MILVSQTSARPERADQRRAPHSLVPVVTNVEARENRDAARVVPLLVEQVTAPVRWVETVQELARLGVTRVVEVGPGTVLGGLVKRIEKGMTISTNDVDGSSQVAKDCDCMITMWRAAVGEMKKSEYEEEAED